MTNCKVCKGDDFFWDGEKVPCFACGGTGKNLKQVLANMQSQIDELRDRLSTPESAATPTHPYYKLFQQIAHGDYVVVEIQDADESAYAASDLFPFRFTTETDAEQAAALANTGNVQSLVAFCLEHGKSDYSAG